VMSACLFAQGFMVSKGRDSSLVEQSEIPQTPLGEFFGGEKDPTRKRIQHTRPRRRQPGRSEGLRC